jgi:hypothetical protein
MDGGMEGYHNFQWASGVLMGQVCREGFLRTNMTLSNA